MYLTFYSYFFLFLYELKANKNAELLKLQQEAMAIETSLRKVKQGHIGSQHEDFTLESTVENITLALSKIAEKRRAQVNK